MDYKYKFSVVIPVYKVEDYLSETIESVIGQTIGFKDNIQVILVNDGSPDNSEAVCLKYRNLYPDNVIYHKKENGGVSSARNAGIPFIEGKYVNFLDSDDKWTENAFEEVYRFFEEHYDEIDVVSCRIRFFDAKDKWHPLDYKFNKGNRIADLKCKDDYNMVQSTVHSAFVKAEAIGTWRFNESVKFGEDSLFINSIMIQKCKCGLLKDALFLYRKRSDLSSAVQGQTMNKSFYLDSIEKFHYGLQKISEEKYGEVIPYIQAAIAYDLQYRTVNDDYKKVLTQEEQDIYFKKYHEVLSKIDDSIILGVRVKGSFLRLVALLEDKNGKKFEDDLIVHEDGRLFYRDVEYCSLKNHKKNFSRIITLKVENGVLKIEMLLAKFIFHKFGENAKVVFQVDDREYPSTCSEFNEELKITREGKIVYYYKIDTKIPVRDIRNGKKAIEIRPVLCGEKFRTTLSMNYPAYLPTSNFFTPVCDLFGNWCVRAYRTVIKVNYYDSIKLVRERKRINDTCNQYLLDKGRKDVAELREKCIRRKSKSILNKKIWLFTKCLDDADDHSEQFFEYVCKNKPRGVRPIFVINKHTTFAERIKNIGETVFIEDTDYLLYFLCAEKIISSSLDAYITNPFSVDQGYYMDLVKGKFYFLQDEISCMEFGWELDRKCKNKEEFDEYIKAFIDFTDEKICEHVLNIIESS